MTPEVSVVIPTYNRAADVRRALTSVLQQTTGRWEAIVVDNHSTDDTRQVVESFKDARIRFLEIHNEGIVARSRNAGIRAATGEFVALLDSDDWWQPAKLERCVAVLRGGADIAYHAMYIVLRNGQRLHWRRTRTRTLQTPVFNDLLIHGNAMSNSSVVMRRTLLMEIDGFSEVPAQVGYEDFDAWLRAARLTERFVRVPATLGYYWRGGNNLLTPERLLRNLEDFRERYLAHDPEWRELSPGWLHYGLGRVYYHMGAWQLSLDHMRAARRRRLLLGERIKSIVTTLVASTRRHADTGPRNAS